MWKFEPDRIRLAREAKELSQSELASKVGVTLQRVVQWEKGKVKPNQDSLTAVCNVTGLAPRFFFAEYVHNVREHDEPASN